MKNSEQIELKMPTSIAKIDKDNLAQNIQKIKNVLKPGMPVLIQQYDIHHMVRENNETALFFSGGNINEEGVFDIQKGKINFPYASINQIDSNIYKYFIHLNWNSTLTNYKIEIPHTWQNKTYNENTHSPAGPSEGISIHSEGTEEIVIGEFLKQQFPEAVKALKFTGDAVRFSLDSFYSDQCYGIEEKEDTFNKEKQAMIRKFTHLRASMNLIKEAAQELEMGSLSSIVARQLKRYQNIEKFFEIDGYPINSEDYLVDETAHPYNRVAFVKTESVGGIYILPFNKTTEEIVDLAFSSDMIRKHYPHGMRENT